MVPVAWMFLVCLLAFLVPCVSSSTTRFPALDDNDSRKKNNQNHHGLSVRTLQHNEDDDEPMVDLGGGQDDEDDKDEDEEDEKDLDPSSLPGPCTWKYNCNGFEHAFHWLLKLDRNQRIQLHKMIIHDWYFCSLESHCPLDFAGVNADRLDCLDVLTRHGAGRTCHHELDELLHLIFTILSRNHVGTALAQDLCDCLAEYFTFRQFPTRNVYQQWDHQDLRENFVADTMYFLESFATVEGWDCQFEGI